MKADLKAEQDNIVKMQTYDLSYFLARSSFGDDSFQYMFVYQPIFRTLQLKKRMKVLIMLLVGYQRS